MIKKVKTKEGNVDFMIESYNSTADVVKDCKVRSITNSSFDDMQKKGKVENNKSWYGVDSYEQALQFLEEGYQPTVEKLKAGIKANLQGNGKRISFHNDIVGYAPIVPLAILGVPNSMINSRMKPIKAKVIDVYYDMTATCNVSSRSIIDAGVKMLSAIIALEQQGYRFNLYSMQVYYSDRKSYTLKIKVKDAMQPIDLKRISFPLTHTGFFRVIGFDWYSKCPEAKYMWGYGHDIERDFSNERVQKMAKELFGDNAVWFSCSEIVKNNEDYVKEILVNAGNKKSAT